MTEYFVPTKPSETEFSEKRSTFIGHVFPVETEEEARERIDGMKKKYHDARHNCWCYLIKDGPVRYSDDGEPQGTAGQPMLSVFQKEGVTNVCCVVTRYFGGVLLGAGGLVRAYTQSAKNALDAAGISVVRRWAAMEVPCSYSRFEEMRRAVSQFGGVEDGVDYGADVVLHVLIPGEQAAAFSAHITDASAGTIVAVDAGEIFRAAPLEQGRGEE